MGDRDVSRGSAVLLFVHDRVTDCVVDTLTCVLQSGMNIVMLDTQEICVLYAMSIS